VFAVRVGTLFRERLVLWARKLKRILGWSIPSFRSFMRGLFRGLNG
jgi:hypothetical protein